MLTNYLIAAVVAAVVVYFLVQKLYAVKSRIDARRVAASELAGILQALGLVRIPEFLRVYSVGDYSGMAQKLQATTALFLTGPAAVEQEFKDLFERMLLVKLGTPEGRAVLSARLADAEGGKLASAPSLQVAPEDAPTLLRLLAQYAVADAKNTVTGVTDGVIADLIRGAQKEPKAEVSSVETPAS